MWVVYEGASEVAWYEARIDAEMHCRSLQQAYPERRIYCQYDPEYLEVQ